VFRAGLLKRNEAKKNQASRKLLPAWPVAASFSGRPRIFCDSDALMVLLLESLGPFNPDSRVYNLCGKAKNIK